MNMQWPEIFSKIFLLVWADIFKVLATENNHSPLSNEQGKFILLSVVQLRKLKTSNLSADNWSEFGDFELRVAAGKKGRLGFVCSQSAILKLEWLDRFKASLFVVDGEILMILILWSN